MTDNTTITFELHLNEDIGMKNSLENVEDYDTLTRVLSEDKFGNILSHFVNSLRSDTNFMFWWDYLQIVKVLLMFIRRQRDGICDLLCLHSVPCYRIFIGMIIELCKVGAIIWLI